jgi:AcrR family transcriptional regulator
MSLNSKGTRTKERILERSAGLFNRYGYVATSLSDVMKETGLEKGGIYNHFSSKEALALEAFEYSVQAVETRYRAGLEGKPRADALTRLNVVLEVFESMILEPPVRGGCPLLNAATEADYGFPALRVRVRRAVNAWLTTIRGILERGQLEGQVRRDVDAAQTANLLFASLEGAVMLSSLYRDPVHIRQMVAHLRAHLETLKPTDRSAKEP